MVHAGKGGMKMKIIDCGKLIITKTGAHLRLDTFDSEYTDAHTPNLISSRWITPDEASIIMSEHNKYSDLQAFFGKWHKLPPVLRAEWNRQVSEFQNPGGVNLPEVENALREEN